MAEKQTNKDRMREIVDSIENGIKALFESDKYRQYLSTMSRFHRYSVNNTMLIYMQRPDATHVAGFNKWRNQFGRNVLKGEKGIRIIAPTPYKKKVEEIKTDPETNAPVLDADGKAVPFPVSWTVKMKKKQKETQDILSYHTQAAGCSDKARAKASGGRQPIEECGRTGL